MSAYDPNRLETLAQRMTNPNRIGATTRTEIADALRELARIKRDGPKPPNYPDWITRTNRED